MSEPKRVYLVTSGAYDSVRIVGAFDDKHLAAWFAGGLPTDAYGDPARVEALPINPYEEHLRAGRNLYNFWLRRDGDNPWLLLDIDPCSPGGGYGERGDGTDEEPYAATTSGLHATLWTRLGDGANKQLSAIWNRVYPDDPVNEEGVLARCATTLSKPTN